jgi:PemK-like, MazF-like toxin of type II toxin-antitoxin system
MLWWVLFAVLVLAVVTVVLVRRPRPSTPPRQRIPKPGAPKPAPPKRRPAPAAGPQPGEIWWADVPYEDGAGHKVRPCLVLRGDGKQREVLKITSQDQSDRNDHVVIPTRTWDPGADHDSWLDLTGPIRVPLGNFEDRAGTLDAKIWQNVRRLHSV